MRSFVSVPSRPVRKNRWASPQRPPTRPSRVCGVHRLLPKMRKAPGRHPSLPASPHGWSRSAPAPLTRRAQAHCARSSSRELADARSRRAKEMQQQRPRACCLAPSLGQCRQHCSSAWLLQIVSAIFDTSSSYHALRERPGRLADVMCSTSSLSCDQCLLILLREDTLPSHRCATSTSM